KQEYINKTQPQVMVTPVPPFTPMDMGLEDRLNYQAAQSVQMDTSQLQGLDAPKFGKSPDDIFADMQKCAEIQAAVRDALKKKPTVVTSDTSPDYMIVDDDSATSSKGKSKEVLLNKTPIILLVL